MERIVLGKGLSALLPQEKKNNERVEMIEIDRLEPSPYQPRQYFSETRIQELADSIKEKGMIQPILARENNGRYEIIAGERRFRAAKLNGLKEIPVIVKKVSDSDVLEISIIENIQREELNRIEEARAYKRLAAEFSLTHEMISQKVSKDRTTITNILRLLELPDKIQQMVEENIISMGHARSLLSLDRPEEQLKLADLIVKKALSVRQCEEKVRSRMSELGHLPKAKKRTDVHIALAEEKLQHQLGTRVKVLQGKKRGKIVIEYFSQDDLNRILEIIHPN